MNDKEYWLRLSERYFEAETTDEEEALLKVFLASEAGQDSDFDELRAVMGYIAVGRHAVCKVPSVKRRSFGKVAAIATAACVLLAIILVPISLADSGEECVAYVSGVKTTDVDRVMQEMQASWRSVQSDDDVPSVELQLEGLFATLDEAQ